MGSVQAGFLRRVIATVEAKCRLSPMVKMYMPLLNESTEVWRPVEVTPVYGAAYRVEGPMPADEEWAFAPGTFVNCRWRTFADGDQRLVPTRDAWPPYRQSIGRLAIVGIVCGVVGWGSQLLPPDDYQPSRPIYALLWLAGSIALYLRFRRRNGFLASTAGMLAIIFGSVFLASLLMRN